MATNKPAGDNRRTGAVRKLAAQDANHGRAAPRETQPAERPLHGSEERRTQIQRR
jgi:hypothetical protein